MRGTIRSEDGLSTVFMRSKAQALVLWDEGGRGSRSDGPRTSSRPGDVAAVMGITYVTLCFDYPHSG
jgi:hypothetical protein